MTMRHLLTGTLMKTNRGTTPFPNVLLDMFMPVLSDTSWRVLCVVARQTLGWNAGGGTRKREDWLAHSQLKKRTGRHSEAISRAIQDLIERGLIEVRDQNGQMVSDAQQRSRYGVHLYFSLSHGLLGLIHTVSVTKLRYSKPTTANLTKEKHEPRSEHGAS